MDSPEMDDKNPSAEIEKYLAQGLRVSNREARRVAYSNLQKRSELKVKCEYNGEKRAMTIPRPVVYDQLTSRLGEMYQMTLNIFYTQSNGEIYVPLLTQKDLDSAVQLVEQNEHANSLRLYLTYAGNTNHRNSGVDDNYSCSPQNTHVRDTPSPPPGSLPPSEKHFRTGSYSSLGEGQFIPEHEGIAYPSHVGSTDSISSIDSSYISGHSNDTYPFRGRRDSRRSVLSDGCKDDPSQAGRRQFGTFPRGYDAVNHPNVEGHQTFPRSTIRPKGPEHDTMSLRSIVSQGSEGTMSTCSSSSSGLPPEEDSPSMYSFYSLQFSKSPRAPSNWKRGKQLGVGAFGEVFVCYDEDAGTELAVKQVQLGNVNAETSKEVRALENELQLLRNFHHEHIVQYYGCQQDRKVLSIFMELMPGGSVKDQINNYGALKEQVVRKYTRQVLEGLAYLHKNVIVHRDIKAANVLRDSNGNVKVGDFGASKRLQTICSATGIKSAVGTPHWMAPEVINGEGYGRKADVWSVACTVVEMLTKKPPFAEYEAFAAMFQIATCKHPKYDLPKETSAVGRDFLIYMFNRKPADRPSAEDLFSHRFFRELT
ncbi:mitogen-activated protein kinase kinase kinase 2-like isoform X1 [Haliotis rufescens]|uniref:mitogen-activated protein kinase kinase kinase 2-like isoform X1 n=2 Tax=Haliotis rufescens TaxID=6454 RepID=UPI001EAF9490|nr:mitogen-activated protein kinase kinase kinase 2-like isoform X1 [Haliotis rufescens]XP_046328306.1 mitogen-activated protein kinase kinase kinase 2-like isoform X1 [Haliotis rufescens]